MDNSTEQYHQHYQQPATPPQTAVAEAGYDVPQSSDQLAAYQAYYAYTIQQPYDYHHHYHHSQYPSQDYPYNYHQEYVPVHPPGVPVPSTQDQAYYVQGDLENHLQLNNTSDHPAVMVDSSMQFAVNLDVVQPAMQPQFGHFTQRGGGGGRRGGRRPFRGRGRGHFANRGPPLPNFATSEPSSAIVPPGQVLASTSAKRPSTSRMVRCEVCRVDCNTNEILEQHVNGKKHKKNVLAQERLQNLNKPVLEAKLTLVKPQAVNPEKDGHSGGGEDSNIQHEQKNTDEELKKQVDLQVEQPQGHGSKRKSKGGRGGKFAKTNEGRRRQAEPPKPKEVMVPFICELCHATCESKVVLDSHLAGKKHSLNLKRFHGHRALYGDAGLQTFYPPHITEPQSSLFIPQGVTDPQALLAQLVTFLLSQAQTTQAPGLMASQIAELAAISQAPPGLVAPAMPPAPQSAGSQFYQNSQPTENENTNVVAESVTADYQLSKTTTASDNIEETVQPGIEQDPSIPFQE